MLIATPRLRTPWHGHDLGFELHRSRHDGVAIMGEQITAPEHHVAEVIGPSVMQPHFARCAPQGFGVKFQSAVASRVTQVK